MGLLCSSVHTRLPLSFFFLNVLVLGDCLVILPLTINGTLKWLSLPLNDLGVTFDKYLSFDAHMILLTRLTV